MQVLIEHHMLLRRQEANGHSESSYGQPREEKSERVDKQQESGEIDGGDEEIVVDASEWKSSAVRQRNRDSRCGALQLV